MNGKWKVFLGILVVPALVLTFACSFLPGNLKNGYIALEVGVPSGARAIESKQYDIDSLDIEVYGPEGELLDSFEWLPPDAETYMIPGVGSGTYKVVVTHNGVNGDENLSVLEEIEFDITAMKITVVRVVPGLIGVLEVEGGSTTDMTGYWTAEWRFDGGVLFAPLYTYIEQTGTDVEGAHYFSGEIIGDTMIWEGDMDEMGVFYETTVYSNGEFNGDFVILNELGEVGEMEGLGLLQGTTFMSRTDPVLFGDLTISGYVREYNDVLNEYEPIPVDLVTSNAMAFTEQEEPATWLNITFFDAENEIIIEIELEEGTFGVGEFLMTEDSMISPRGQMSFSDSDFGMQISSDGIMNISRFDDVGIAGTIMLSGDSDCTISFDIPFAPKMPW